MSDNWGFDTRQIHAGQEPDPTTGARAVPIYQTTSYQFRDTTHAANLFALAEIGNIYTRIMNPTQGVFEARIASLEGATATAVGLPGALAVASGQAAEALAIQNLAEAGSHIVASAALYGGTYNLLHYTLPKFGIDATFVEDPDNLDEWRNAIRPNTKAFYGETIGNPRNDVLDIEGISKVAHDSAHCRQHRCVTMAYSSVRVGRRHRGALGDQVHWWPWHLNRRPRRRWRFVRLLGQRQVPDVHRTRPQLPRPSVLASAWCRLVHH